jgi:hypothetical protein
MEKARKAVYALAGAPDLKSFVGGLETFEGTCHRRHATIARDGRLVHIPARLIRRDASATP